VHVADLGAGDAVRLRGFRRDAGEEFGRASFFLLTSRSEGFPLVLAEGMARGCIPISYDMPYGPSDIITDGVDGFLVPNGDIDALAERIASIVASTPEDLAPMREAGHRRALEFNDEHVMELWAATLADVARQRGF